MYQLVTITQEEVNHHETNRILFTDYPAGIYLVSTTRLEPKANIKDFRAVYFAKLDFLCNEVGEKRYDLHKIIKESLIIDSTKSFTEVEWIKFLAEFEQWTFITYSIILP